jgi:hypothetical protein
MSSTILDAISAPDRLEGIVLFRSIEGQFFSRSGS